MSLIARDAPDGSTYDYLTPRLDPSIFFGKLYKLIRLKIENAIESFPWLSGYSLA